MRCHTGYPHAHNEIDTVKLSPLAVGTYSIYTLLLIDDVSIGNPDQICGNTFNGTVANLTSIISTTCTNETEFFQDNQSAILVYPNPVSEILHFTSEISGITILDISGKTVMHKSKNKNDKHQRIKSRYLFYKLQQ